VKPTSTTAAPVGSTTPAAPPTATNAAPRPFDHAAAAKSIQQAGSNAKFHCKGKDGPPVVSATVFFNPAGHVQRVSMDPMVASKPASLCVSMMLHNARVPEFDGPNLQSFPATVATQ
jgi:hypothetical protein